MLPEFTSHAKQSKTRTVRYLDGSVGPELQSRDVMLVFLIAISCEYSGSNPSVFNQLNRSLLKILFLTDSGTDVRAYHVWNKYHIIDTSGCFRVARGSAVRNFDPRATLGYLL